MPIKFELKNYVNKTFVETGTYHGKGCINAIESGFEVIHSIEILKENFEIAKQNLKPYEDKASINLYLGDSATALQDILSKIDEPATFWLDGHGGYAGTGSGLKNCPLYEELDQIKNHHIKNHTIMIDDVRIINADAWGTSGISLEGLKNKLLEINPEYQFTFEDGMIKNDCLIAKIK
jgi:hypothetical protein